MGGAAGAETASAPEQHRALPLVITAPVTLVTLPEPLEGAGGEGQHGLPWPVWSRVHGPGGTKLPGEEMKPMGSPHALPTDDLLGMGAPEPSLNE